jgi:hypothetical protein
MGHSSVCGASTSDQDGGELALDGAAFSLSVGQEIAESGSEGLFAEGQIFQGPVLRVDEFVFLSESFSGRNQVAGFRRLNFL